MAVAAAAAAAAADLFQAGYPTIAVVFMRFQPMFYLNFVVNDARWLPVQFQIENINLYNVFGASGKV